MKILDIHFPNKKALGEDVDLEVIAEVYQGVISGGDIKNIVLNAARIAAADGNKKIMQKHLVEACVPYPTIFDIGLKSNEKTAHYIG